MVPETAIHSAEAIGLYRREGYDEIPKFEPYLESDVSLYMGKQLDSS
jgi:hypothetical protein